MLKEEKFKDNFKVVDFKVPPLTYYLLQCCESLGSEIFLRVPDRDWQEHFGFRSTSGSEIIFKEIGVFRAKLSVPLLLKKLSP
jgi:hypothetical protein